MRILIGMPVKDMIPSQVAKCIDDMIIYTIGKGIEVETVYEHGGLFVARDRIFARAIKYDFDYCLQIDSDQTFTADALVRLLEHKKDIITGLYVGQEEHHKPVLFTKIHPFDSNEGAYATKYGLKKLIDTGSIFEIEGCGAGFLLVSNHAMRLVKIHGKGYFEPYKMLGEDVSFCWRAKHMANLKIWCDPTIPIGHLKFFEYNLSDWDGTEAPTKVSN